MTSSMNAANMQTAAVIGAGTMGHGIAQVLAMSGIEVRLFDIDAERVEHGLAQVA
ncbi:MAG: 3-hydroxyacyl-CoA dehydrogenase NAD-binding domain-containing protein, partial [bacterium]